MARISVDQAQIHTASVEIKTLTIKGKQVTLAVFRQLQQEPLFDADGFFVGLPWGTVNYHPEKNCPTTEHEMTEVATVEESHLHVVWQKSDELRRATVYQPQPHPDPKLYRSEHGDRWLKVALLAGWRPPQDRSRYSWSVGEQLLLPREEGQPGQIPVGLSDAGTRLLNSEDTLSKWGDQLEPDVADRHIRAKRISLEALARNGYDYCAEDVNWMGCMDALWAEVTKHADEIDRWQRRFCERWAELEAVPQLFIAV